MCIRDSSWNPQYCSESLGLFSFFLVVFFSEDRFDYQSDMHLHYHLDSLFPSRLLRSAKQARLPRTTWFKKIRSNNSTQSDSDRIEISFWFLNSFVSMEPKWEPSHLLISAGHHTFRNQVEPSWTKDGTKPFANLCWTSHVSEPSGAKLNQGRNQAIC